MKSFIILSLLTLLLCACEDESIDLDKFIYPVSLKSSRAEGRIILEWQLPIILFNEESLNYLNPNSITAERYELYVSETDTTKFQWITEVNLNADSFIYPENISDKDYYFIMKCSAKGAYPSFSNIVWVQGGSNQKAEKLFELPLDHHFDLWDLTSDDQQLIYSRNTNENYCCDTKVFSFDFLTETEELFYQKNKMPSLSFDENYLAFVSSFAADTFPEPYNLGTHDFNTNEITQLTTGHNNYQYPTWSKDGKWIFYLSPNEAVHNAWNVFQISLDNHEKTLIIDAETMPVKGKAMSVSSKNGVLAFTARENTYNGDIYFYDVVSKNIIEFEQSEWDAYNPAFSPNGDFIAFLSTRSGKEEIWVKNLQNDQYYQMTGSENIYPLGKLLWKKDNSKIIFRANGKEDDGVFSVDFKL